MPSSHLFRSISVNLWWSVYSFIPHKYVLVLSFRRILFCTPTQIISQPHSDPEPSAQQNRHTSNPKAHIKFYYTALSFIFFLLSASDSVDVDVDDDRDNKYVQHILTYILSTWRIYIFIFNPLLMCGAAWEG